MILDAPKQDPYAPISLEEAKQFMAEQVWADDPALRLVLQDADKAEAYEEQKKWAAQWPSASVLYQSPYVPRFWEGTQSERASLPNFTIATAVNSLVPQVIGGMFSDNPPFITQNLPGTAAQAARANGALISYQLEQIEFRREIELGAVNSVLYGTSVWKWGWDIFPRKVVTYERKNDRVTVKNPLSDIGGQDIVLEDPDEEFEQVITEEVVQQPAFEHIVDLRHILVDPTLNVPDIRKAKYVIHRTYVTFEDLDHLRTIPGYDIPPQDELIRLFFPPREEAVRASSESDASTPGYDLRSDPRYQDATIDPFQQPLELLERWDNKTCISVLNRKKTICNVENEYGEIPFLSVNWWDVPGAFFGLGMAKIIGSDQRLLQGMMQLMVDNATLNLNSPYFRTKGKSIPTQSIRMAPGKIVEQDEKGSYEPMQRTPVVPEAQMLIGLAQARVEQVSGASEMATQGVAGSSGHSNLARTAAGANLLSGGTGARIGNFVDKLATQVMLPFIYRVLDMNKKLLPSRVWKKVLSEDLQHAFFSQDKGDLKDLLTARMKFSILAGSKMQARRNMAQSLPIIIQFLTSEQIGTQLQFQGKKVDVSEVMRMLFEVSDWKNFNDVVVDMTDEDKQRAAAQSPAAMSAQKMQGQAALQQQKHNNKLDESDQENISRAGREILRHTMVAAATPEAITGEPGGTGFGSGL